MSWYQSPIQPMDPVIVSGQQKPPIRYFRDNFANTGQHSYVKPPAQDQAQWQSLLNIQPITQGVLNPRWGYVQFAGLSNSPNRLYNFQSDSLGTRAIIATGLTNVSAFLESGISYNSSIFTPATASSGVLRSITSRNFQYFCDGNGALNPVNHRTGDSLKWDGSSSGGVTNIGITSTDVTTNQVSGSPTGGAIGPNTGTTAVDVPYPTPRAWNNPAGVFSNSVASAASISFSESLTVTQNPAPPFNFIYTWSNPQNPYSDYINATGFFNSVSGSVVNGIQVSVQYRISPSLSSQIGSSVGGSVQMIKNGVLSGTLKGLGLIADGALHTLNLGNASDLWGTSFSPADLVQSNFGIQLQANAAFYSSTQSPGGFISSYNVQIPYVTITVFMGGGAGTATTSGGGVGINAGVPGGSVNLTIGRVYYLVANTSTVGHFSDLTVASANSGAATNTEYNLLLATFNDPQVDTKYVLATADGGDPSILYQTQVLVPGLTVSSWVINGSNQVTFTGTYYNQPQSGTSTVASLKTIHTDTDGWMLFATMTSTPSGLIAGGLNATKVTFSGVGTATWLNGLTLSLKTLNGAVLGFLAPGGAPLPYGPTPDTGTATYPGPQSTFTIGQTVKVGGLSHGSYMNNSTLTVTAATGSTVTANFTHAADSFTEIGVVGNLSFSVPNIVALVVDNTPDPTLVLNQPLLFTDQSGNTTGVALNSPPPGGSLIIKHQGRLWMAGVPNATHSVYFSKSIADLTLPNGFIAGKYEEAWPGSNYFDVSDGAESVSGLLSDGSTLYIGTQRHIRRLLGNTPTNFQQPQVVHPEVGVMNQEVWQIVFMQGAPSGSCWLTPDFRVIQSDFNTYLDIGTPIQDILNNLQPTAQSLAHAAFVADGEFEFYVLAVPYKQSTYCDTHLVYDLRSRQWYTWQPAAGSLSMLYNVTQAGLPQWLFIEGGGTLIDNYIPSAITDNGTPISIAATTTWLHLGEPTRRKILNDIQVFGTNNMTISINGDNNQADFTSLRPVVYNRSLRQSPFGTWTLYLTGAITKHKYFQVTFNGTAGQSPFLGAYSISAIPMDDL